MTARHICTLSPVTPHTVGRRVVFWIESGAVKNTLGDRTNPSTDGIYGSGICLMDKKRSALMILQF